MQWAKVENTRVHPIWKSRKVTMASKRLLFTFGIFCKVYYFRFKVRLTPNTIFGMGNILVILRRNVIYRYSKKPHLDQLFHCQSFQI